MPLSTGWRYGKFVWRMSRTAWAAYDVMLGSRPTTDAMIASSDGSFGTAAEAAAVGVVRAAIAGARSMATKVANNARNSVRRGREMERLSKFACIIYS